MAEREEPKRQKGSDFPAPSTPWIPEPISDNVRTNTFIRSPAKMPVTKRKATGAHFTPPDLARLVAERVVTLASALKGPLRVLDPACGDGNLLCAINDALPRDLRRRVTLVGIENDEASFASLRARQQTHSMVAKPTWSAAIFWSFLAASSEPRYLRPLFRRSQVEMPWNGGRWSRPATRGSRGSRG